MNKQPKLWEILLAFIPVMAGIVIWLWNLGTQVQRQEIRIENIEQIKAEYKVDIKEINSKLETILIKMESKADRENQK